MIRKLATKEARQVVSETLRELRRNIDNTNNYSISLDTLNSYYIFSNQCEQESKKIINNKLRNELFLTHIALGCLTSTCLSIKNFNSDIDFFTNYDPKKHKFANPNFVLRSHLIQLANYSLSVVQLIKSGLDSPARSLLRITNELNWQTLVMLNDMNIIEKYSKCHSDKESNEIWYQLFAKGKLQKKLEIIDEAIGFPKQIIDQIKQERRYIQQRLSQSVHHSFVATNFGAFNKGFENNERLNCAIMGSATTDSIETLSYLNEHLGYFIAVFFTIVESKEHVALNYDNEHWFNANILRNCSLDLLYWIYKNKV